MRRLNAPLAIAALVVGNGCVASSPPGGTTSAIPGRPLAQIEDWLVKEYGEYGPVRYALAWHDLNADGADEAIAYVVGPGVCGSGGCNTVIFTRGTAGWRVVGNVSVSRTPVTVLDSAHQGWRDITVAIAGGGGSSGIARLAFDGGAYPHNPTVPPAVPVEQGGTVLIGAEPVLTAIETR